MFKNKREGRLIWFLIMSFPHTLLAFGWLWRESGVLTIVLPQPKPGYCDNDKFKKPRIESSQRLKKGRNCKTDGIYT